MLTMFNHFVAIEINYTGKGIIDPGAMISEYKHLFFVDEKETEEALKVIDKVIRHAKKKNTTLTIREGNQDQPTQRRLFVDFDWTFREYGTANVGECKEDGTFDDFVKMDAGVVRSICRGIIEEVARKQKLSEQA